MKTQFHCVGLFGKYRTGPMPALADAHAATVLREIAAFLSAQGCEVILEAGSALNTGITEYPTLSVQDMGARCDLALVVGGDGTMLGVGRVLASFGVPLIGINQGRLGFITDIALDEYAQILPAMLCGDYEQDCRSLMHARVMRHDMCVFESRALNDVVVNRGATSGMVELRVEVDGHLVANQRADGLIIASPTGSTAYALSAGGPLLHPSIPGWVLVPIAPHTLSNRPIVLSDAMQVSIEIVAGRDASANFDVQSFAKLQHGDKILVQRSQQQACFLHPKGWSYFDTLRKKLHWNEGGS